MLSIVRFCVFCFLAIFAKDAFCESLGESSSEFVNFDVVKSIITKNGIDSVSKLIPYLPESYRRNFTLMKASQSLQQATPESPRVILFGETAQSLIAFNGDPQLEGFNSVEMIDFNVVSDSFEFHAIEFSSSAPPTFSEKNPRTCFGCHNGSSELRPNWGSYAHWPNAFGENDDFLNPNEVEELSHFKALMLNSPFYSSLIISGSENAPYLDKPKGHLRLRPNERLTLLLARWNAKKVARHIHEKRNGSLYQILILLDKQSDHTELKKALSLQGVSKILSNQEIAKINAGWGVLETIKGTLALNDRDFSLNFGVDENGVVTKFGNGLEYNDGSITIKELLINELWKSLCSEFPDAKSLYAQAPFAEYPPYKPVFNNYPWAYIIDNLGGSIDNKTINDPAVGTYLLTKFENLLQNL